jgi:hypothetical protein
MKKLLVVLLSIMMASCATYKEYVSVVPSSQTPNGTKALIVPNTSIEQIKQVFKNNQILYKTFETGIETEIIMLDEGTKAQYKVYAFDSDLKITAYWGITDKVKSQMVIWAGANAASAYNTESMDLVLYDSKALRPKKVFDYVTQLLNKENIIYQTK